MLRFTTLFSAVTLMSVALWITGCGAPNDNTPSSSSGNTPSEHDHGDHDHSEHDHGSHEHGETDSAEIAANLAKLSAEDRAAAEKQKTCPVTDEALGSMDAPIKLEVAGHTVFICCKGCEKELRENPDTYLAKLGEGDHHKGHDHDVDDHKGHN